MELERRTLNALSRLVLAVAAALPWLLVAPAADAAESAWLVAQSAQCTAAIQAAQTKYALPPGLLGTIAKVESGRPITTLQDVRAWPWTIDADGQGLFLDSKAAAVAWVKQAQTRGLHFIDVGCLQVDLEMHPDAFHSLDEAFDPVANADYAARYLRALQVEAHGDWNVAVGLYHSHTPDLAADYRNRVAEVGAGILTGIGGPEPLYMRAIRQGTLRLALAGGGTLRINLRRQPHARPQRAMSRCQIAAVLRPLLASRVRGCSARG
jgi:Transglycosylase SLT domain